MSLLKQFKPVKTYIGNFNTPITIKEWADMYGSGCSTSNVRANTKVEVYQYPNGNFSHLIVGGRKVGEHGLFTPIEYILSNCSLTRLI